jgi:hypothetical protein
MSGRFEGIVSESTARPAGTKRVARGDAMVMAILALVFLVLYSMIEWRLRALGTFSVNDLLFDADPRTRTRAIAHGFERLLLIHPLFPYEFTVPIRIVARVWTVVTGSGAGGEAGLRELLAMAVAPAFGAAAVAVMARTLMVMGLGRLGAAVCATGFGLSFSMLVFGSVPEHWVVSNLLLSVALLMCATAASGRSGRVLQALWWPLGVALTGVTVTNIAFAGCCYFVTSYYAGRSLWPAVWATVKYLSVVASVTLVLALAAAAASGDIRRWLPREAGGAGSESMLLQYLAANPLQRAARTPKAAADSIVPRELTLVPAAIAEPDTPAASLSLETGAKWLGMPLVLMLLVVAAIATHRQADGGISPPVAAALGILAGNVSLHAVFGKEYFLYSQHWIASLWLVLAGLWRSRYSREPFRSAAALGALAVVAYLNSGTLRELFDMVARTGLNPGSQ